MSMKSASGPIDRSETVNQLSTLEKKWFAVYTKYKCEKYVSDHLTKKKIDNYIPIVKKTKRYTRKIKHYEVPLINCYVFVHITKSEYLATLETEYVMKFLRQGKDLIAIPQMEIDVLKRVVGDVEEVCVTDVNTFSEGEEVEVMSGHLTGMRGIVLLKSGKKSFLVELKSLGFQLRINIDHKLLKPLTIREVMA